MKLSTTSSDMKSTGAHVKHIRGQGLTEYAIILSLVAIAAIGATSFFGDSVKASFVALGSELTGGDKYDMQAKTAASLNKADAGVTGATTLKNYRN